MKHETKYLKRVRNEVEVVDFLKGIYEYNLGFNYFLPSFIFLIASIYALYMGNILIATASALTAIIPTLPFLKKYKKEIHYENDLIPNKEDKSFFLQLGWEIKEFKKDTKSTNVDDNIIKPLLISADQWVRHGVICGTTGSGKTVDLQFLLKQQLNQGCGSTFVNGKPDKEMKREIYALTALYGREQDFYFLDFADILKSMAISIFDVGIDSVDELFKFMLGEKGDDEWGVKALNLMSSLLDVFMELKKYGLIFPSYEIDNINNLDDLLNLEHKYTMGFYILDTYMTSKSLLKLLKLFHRLYSNNNSKRFFNKITGNDKEETIKQSFIHSSLISSMEKLTGFDYEDLTSKTYEQLLELNDRAFYSTGIAIDFWSDILKKFKRDYGNILDNTTPHININDIIRGHKILYVSLPGTKSKQNLGLLGKMIVAQIKSAYERIQSASPLKMPHTIYLDEFNSWSKGIEGFGDTASQTRSKKLAFYFLYQSSLKSIDSGENLEGTQILANANNKIFLKVEDLDLIKEIVELFGKEEVLEEQNNYVSRDADINDKKAYEKTLTKVERDITNIKEIKSLQPGQKIILLGSDGFKAVGDYFEPIRFESANPSIDIPIEARYKKERFLNEFKKYKNTSNSISC